MGIRRGSSMKAKSVKTASNVTLASSLSLALLLGCAAQQSPPVSIQDSDESQKELATEVQNETEEQIIINEDLTASELLEVALGFLKSGRDAIAAEAFTRAIATGYLSDAGRSLAYWYIHLAHKSQGNDDQSIDALSSFVILAEDLMASRGAYQFAGAQPDDFIMQFDLSRRLSLARAVMSSSWAKRSSTFGRSPEHPVMVHDDIELAYFVELSSACTTGGHEMQRQTLLVGGELIHQVTIHCAPSTAGQNFYFEIHKSAKERFPLARR
jgi:hypothetical protein